MANSKPFPSVLRLIRKRSCIDSLLQPNSWQPFGFGIRACIGRPFAWQEAIIALAELLQKFDFVLDDPSYELELKQTLTIKPAHFFVHALPRERRPQLLETPSIATFGFCVQGARKPSLPPSPSTEAKQPMYVLYGSNTGTSENFAQRVANEAPAHGTFLSPSCNQNTEKLFVRFPRDTRHARLRRGPFTHRRACGRRVRIL